jgi:dTDP-4-dehydrorhamnose 3,5-epimerase
MKLLPTPIANLVVVETTPSTDSRGAFARLYCERELSSVIGERRIVQINHSCTTGVGTVRGLHFQRPPHTEMKLVRCLKGRVWDVVVDLRPDSSTFLTWHAEELSSSNARMLVIPDGAAHGFQVLESGSELLYLHTAFYTPSAEDGLRFNDPRLAIRWPLHVTEVSKRDASHPLIDNKFIGIVKK